MLEILLSGMLNAARGSGQEVYIWKINILSKGLLALLFSFVWFLYCLVDYSMLQSVYLGCCAGFGGFLLGSAAGWDHRAISGVYSGTVKFPLITRLTDKIYKNRSSRIWGAWWYTLRASLYYPSFALISLFTGPPSLFIGLGVFIMGLMAYLLGFPLKDNPRQQAVQELLYGSWLGFLVWLCV